jgi:hypothetical protein
MLNCSQSLGSTAIFVEDEKIADWKNFKKTDEINIF